MDMIKYVNHLTKLLNNNEVHQAIDYLRSHHFDIQSKELKSIFTQLKDNQANNYLLFKERFFS